MIKLTLTVLSGTKKLKNNIRNQVFGKAENLFGARVLFFSDVVMLDVVVTFRLRT